MNQRLSLPEVEARVRATLQARSEDCARPATMQDEGRASATTSIPVPDRAVVSLTTPATVAGPAGSVTSAEPGEPAGPAGPTGSVPAASPSGRHPTRPLLAAAAILTVLAGAGVATYVTGRSDGPEGHVQAAASGQEPAPDPLPTCGTDLPVTVTVPGATPVAGPMPGADPAEPGQVVVHWQRPGLTVEARWPARPQVVYDLDGPAPSDPPPALEGPLQEGASVAMSLDPPRAEYDLIVDDGNAPEIVVDGAVLPPPGCDVMELSQTTDDVQGRGGVQFIRAADGTPTGAPVDLLDLESGMPYTLLDLNPLVAERREVDEAPDAVLRCEDADIPSRSGPADPASRGERPSDVLQAFLASEAGVGAGRSGYVELIQPDGTVTYGHDPFGEGWTTLVTVVPQEDGSGWYLGGWRGSGC